MGTGSGILAKTALESGAKSVLAVDKNPLAVKSTSEQGINAKKSNLFSNISGKFDLIIFNPPYLPLDSREDKESQLATTGGKNGDEIILKFFSRVKKHMAKNGKILVLLSSLTPRNKLYLQWTKLKLQKKKLATQKTFMETLEVWLLEQQ